MTITRTGKKSEWSAEYDVLRVIVTLTVIYSHLKIFTYESAYGSFWYPGYNTKCYYLLSQPGAVIGVFQMPLFMALSGALFYHTITRRKYADLLALVKDKVRRLLIPFFFVCVAYEFPLKYITGYYYKGAWLRGLIFGELLVRGATHLWFLPTLFLIFMIVGALELYWPGHQKIKLVLFTAAYMINIGMEWRSSSPLQMGLWFYLGYLFEPHKNEIGGG